MCNMSKIGLLFWHLPFWRRLAANCTVTHNITAPVMHRSGCHLFLLFFRDFHLGNEPVGHLALALFLDVEIADKGEHHRAD